MVFSGFMLAELRAFIFSSNLTIALRGSDPWQGWGGALKEVCVRRGAVVGFGAEPQKNTHN